MRLPGGQTASSSRKVASKHKKQGQLSCRRCRKRPCHYVPAYLYMGIEISIYGWTESYSKGICLSTCMRMHACVSACGGCTGACCTQRTSPMYQYNVSVCLYTACIHACRRRWRLPVVRRTRHLCIFIRTAAGHYVPQGHDCKVTRASLLLSHVLYPHKLANRLCILGSMSIYTGT